MTQRLCARIHTFHVDSYQISEITRGVDNALGRFWGHRDFRGLLILERGDSRHEMVAITLWADNGIEDTEMEAEASRQQIASTADVGVSTKSYNVVRFAPKSADAFPQMAESLAH
jgi:hypothetical protein